MATRLKWPQATVNNDGAATILNEERFMDFKLVLGFVDEMTTSDVLVRSTSTLAPSSGPSETDLVQPQKREGRLASAKYRLSHDVRVARGLFFSRSVPCLPRL